MSKINNNIDTTIEDFDKIISQGRQIFESKMINYGTSWRVLRNQSITDQILNKVRRITNIEEKGIQKVNEDLVAELIGILNYSIIAIIQLEYKLNEQKLLSNEKLLKLYDDIISEAVNLMKDKNHDYDAAWKKMRITSIVDFIYVKLLRIQNMEDKTETDNTEGIISNYQDIINYAIFAIIRIKEQRNIYEK